MTHRLILTRHAKSSYDDPAMADLDRPLNPRGTRSAAALGRWLTSRGDIPDEVLCSTAKRTQETWAGIAAEMAHHAELRLVPALYQAGPDAMLAVLQSASYRMVMMLGHNPGIAAFAAMLCATQPLDPEFAHYPTGATLVLEFDIPTWADAQPGSGQVIDFITPRSLE